MVANLSTSASAPKVKHSTESILFGVDFTPLLSPGETLAGTPIVNASPTGLSISSQAVNAATFPNDEGGTVAVGCGARFRIVGGTDGTNYLLTVIASTTAGNTRTAVCILQVRDS